ncbi:MULTISPECIES: acyl CoA:acetate/3-ketoacid CoA transferase [Staphylococcus]|uniref:Malonate decarboxylase subunit alpha n=1 Tax=Staphylococcus hsinchuensis TaxID=3051183 RepID=A0ABZ3EE81_9STAP|nr:malonate decarboxylase subunit alpha [Staphylococcus sp. Marseille-Q6910]
MKVISSSQLTNLINTGDVISMAALSSGNMPMALFKAIVEQFDHNSTPRELTFLLGNDISDFRGDGYDLDDFVKRGMVKRLITSIITGSPATIEAMRNGDIEAYYLPQGVIATHYRSQTPNSPGTITKIGLHTTVDPEHSGGKVNSNTTEDLVTRVEIEGELYLKYHFPEVDVALLRGTYADTKGNIFMHHESHLGEGYSVAAATHRNKGKVIVQVKEIVPHGQYSPRDVFIPGELVDYVVVNQDSKYHRQAIQTYYDPALAGHHQITEMREPYLEFNTRKVILRRAAQLLQKDDVVSIGFGINNELSNLLVEESAHDLVQLNIDTGVFGGMIGSRAYFGMNYNLDARMRHDQTWDFINNDGLDIAFLSFAQIDQHGNVNVSKFGDKMNGCGGFIDISQTVKTIVFSGAMTVGGKLHYDNGEIEVVAQGHTQKFVDAVDNIDFNASYAATLGQKAYFVTERAVFELTPEGLMLIEIAPGIDLERDVLANMSFKPIISEYLREINVAIFNQQWGGLADVIKSHKRT